MSTTETLAYVTDHRVTVSQLTPETAYVYSVRSKDAAGNAVTSTTFSFETLAKENVHRLYLPILLKIFNVNAHSSHLRFWPKESTCGCTKV